MSANLSIRPPTFYANGPSVLALPKGRLFGAAFTSVQKLGIKVGDDRTYHCTSDHKNVTARVVKARAIPQLVALGIFNAGFCGIDLVREAGVEEQTIPVADLGTDSVVIVAASDRPDILLSPPKRPIVIATEYPQLASSWAMSKGLAHIIVQTYGATEGYVPEAADIVVDCVATGATMRANGLTILDTIGESSTHLVVNRRRWNTGGPQDIINAVREFLPPPKAAFVVAVRGHSPDAYEVLAVHTTYENRGLGLPGGIVEPGEDPLQAAIREMVEETGIVPTSEARLIYSGWVEKSPVATYFVSADRDMDPRSSAEGQARWCNPSELVQPGNKYRHYNALALNATGVRVGLE